MTFISLAFLLGDLFLQLFSSLPDANFVYGLLGTGIVIFYFSKFNKVSLYFLVFLSGFAWSFYYASSLLTWSLPKDMEGQSLEVTGYIASLAKINLNQASFDFYTEKIRYKNYTELVHQKIKLNWRECKKTPLKPGDQWRFQVKLKRIHGTQNPGGFDMEAWAITNGIRATGYVLPSAKATFMSGSKYYLIEQLRFILLHKIEKILPKSSSAHWLPALMLGERNNIPAAHWQVLRNTGTNHLMAIGGLHIGMLAGFVHLLVSWCWRRQYRLLLILPAQLAGASSSLIAALCYGALAGFAIPAQRACIMLALVVVFLLLRLKILPWYAWSCAMLMVLILNPLSVLTESFWLSFATIALIIYGMTGRLSPRGLWWKWGRVQWVIGLGLIPLSLFLFQECSLVSFLANSIAIPWLGFFILPLCFISLLCILVSPSLASCFLYLADKSMSAMWALLACFSQLSLAHWAHAAPGIGGLLLATLAMVFLLAPNGIYGRWLGSVFLLPLLFTQPHQLQDGDIRLLQIDVGQGLASLIQTRHHSLLFDAGPKISENADSGERIILPFLYSQGVYHLDMLVISHGDNDHIGGAAAIIKSILIKSIRTSVPEKLNSNFASFCLAGERWHWDGVDFEFLYPSISNLHLGNDSSCVLRISNGSKVVLLTGDIEKNAEKVLLETQLHLLAADVLVAPHHGSKTSAMPEFVEAVQPHYVIYATGYRNRYHFPHAPVVSAYQKINSIPLDTVQTGAIDMLIPVDGLIKPINHRDINHRYWFFTL